MFWTTAAALILSFELFRLFELRRWTALYAEILCLQERTPETLGAVLKKAGRVEPWAELLALAGLTGLLFTPAGIFSFAVLLLTVAKELSILFLPVFRRHAITGKQGALSAVLLIEGILSAGLLALALLKLLKKT
jgi:hypothetical protein